MPLASRYRWRSSVCCISWLRSITGRSSSGGGVRGIIERYARGCQKMWGEGRGTGLGDWVQCTKDLVPSTYMVRWQELSRFVTMDGRPDFSTRLTIQTSEEQK